jgi:hypothetical protein
MIGPADRERPERAARDDGTRRVTTNGGERP